MSTDTDENLLSLSYDNNYNDSYFYFETKDKKTDNPTNNILVGYYFSDFDKIEISFENGLKKGMKYQDAIKLFDKSQILNYDDLKFSNYIEIKNKPYKVTLIFGGENNELREMNMNIKNYR